jgi:hypothetical protein
MDLRNKTPYAADLFNCVVTETGLLAAVVVRSTFSLRDGGLQLDTEAPVPVAATPVKIGECELDGEKPFLRNGVDLFIFGRAYATDNEPTEQLVVEIEIGSGFKRQILVTGNRIWEKSWKGVVPGKAEPFVVMPLTYAGAYGGKAMGETLPMEYPHNPVGKGFYLEEDEAIGQPLPNLEDPNYPIKKWNDQPEPVGVEPYSSTWGLRMINSIELDDQDPPKMKRIKPEYFNNAHPNMIIYSPVNSGDQIRVSHLTSDGDLQFEIPDIMMHVHVQLEDRHFLFPLQMESIGIKGDEQQVFFTSRAAFKYDVIPLERRMVTVYPGAVPDTVPQDYVIDWETVGATI